MNSQPTESALETGKKLLENEAAALSRLASRLDHNFAKATALILNHTGKIVLSGVGKSGLIARKIAATLCSTGTPAIFMHSTDAVHGDLGVFQPKDPAILISKSGATAEIVRLLPILRSMGSPIIAIVCNANSPIAAQADITLNLADSSEADPLGLAPTTSTILTLALGDALAAALMNERHFNAENFARFHPAGQLGRNLTTKVAEAMHPLARVARVAPSTPLRELVVAMTNQPLGAACVTDAAGNLVGLVTDGDLRRALHQHENLSGVTARDVMTPNPIRALPDMPLAEAARIMEDRPSQLSVLPVVSSKDDPQLLGLLRIHDIYESSIV